MDRGRLRLLCLVALALVVRGALGQAFIASAATQRVQERVHEILVSGGKLTPEALLSRDLPAAVPSYGAQGASAQLQDASKTTIQVAAVEKLAAPSNTAATTDAASTAATILSTTAAVQASQPSTADNDVETAAKELKLKWALQQTGSVTIQEPDGQYDAQNEAAQVRRKIAGIDMLSQQQLKSKLQHQIQQKVQQQLQQQLVLKEQGRLQDRAITVLAPRTEIDYIEIIPDAEGDESTPEFWQEANSRLVSQIPTLKNLPAKGDADDYSANKEVEWGLDAGGDQEQQHGGETVRRVRVVERKEKLTLINRRVSSDSDGQEEDEEQQQKPKQKQRQKQKQKQQEDEEEQWEDEREQELQHQEGSDEGSSKQPAEDSTEKEEIINRLNQVDWKSVFEAAQREAEAEERAAEEEKARQKAEADARRAEQKKRQEEEEKKARAEREEALRRQQRAADARKAADAKKSEEEQKYAAEEEHKYKQQLSEQQPSEYSKVPVSRLIIQEKNRSPLRHFPGGGIYSFTSELTCMSDEEYEQKAAFRSFPMVTSRMRKVTVGLCEWTVAEVSPTPVNKNVFLLGNGWATCTFLKTAEDQCMRPLSGGLTLTIQALLYQFAQPKGIKEADTEALVTRSGATKVKPAVSKSDKTTGAAPAVGATVAAESATVATAAKAKNPAKTAVKTQSGPYLMEVELQNVFVGLITGAIGPKKAKFKQGAIQFAFGPPPDANEKSYAIETMLPPVHLGGPSLEELQDGQIKLVPGTYQIAFDEE